MQPPPTSSERKKVRWLRIQFYDLYQREKSQQRGQDGRDRLRRLFRKFPVLARLTYKYNRKAIKTRRQEGLKLRNLEKYYLLMNWVIRKSVSVPPPPRTSRNK